MRIQSINQSTTPSFQRFVVHPGSFEALKKSKFFPPKSDTNYKNYLMTFYKDLMKIKLDILEKIVSIEKMLQLLLKTEKFVLEQLYL